MMDLLLAVLGRGDASALDRLEPHEWAGLLDAADHHRVTPLLWHRLQERGAADLPPPAVRRRLAELHVLGALRAEARRRQLGEALGALAAVHVRVVQLKGAYLAEHAYPAAALRPMGDIDLLVPADGFDRAVAALVAHGYTPPDEESHAAYRDHRHPPPLRRPGAVTLELHTTIEPCTPPFRLPLPDVWRRAQPAASAGEPALTLAPEDLLLHLATHMGRTHLLGASLVSLYDVAVWLDRFGGAADWDALVRRATESETRRFVYAALELSRAALSAPAPAEVRRALRGDADDADDAAVRRAVGLLRWSRDFPADPVALLDVRSSWAGLRRLAGLLAPSALRQRRRPPAARAAASSYPLSARWAALARLLVSPSARRAVVQQSAGAEQLRRWALEDG